MKEKNMESKVLAMNLYKIRFVSFSATNEFKELKHQRPINKEKYSA